MNFYFFPFLSLIIYLIHFKCINADDFIYLDKYGSVEVDGSITDIIIFRSKEFTKSDTLHFQFSSLYYCSNKISFQYEDFILSSRAAQYEAHLDHSIEPVNQLYEAINGLNYTVFYYDIRKSDYYLKRLNGDYLILGFHCDSFVEIKNNIFDHSSSGLSDGALIAIIVCSCAVVIVVVIIIVYRCRKRKVERPVMGYVRDGVMYPMPDYDPQQQQQIPPGNSIIPMTVLGQTRNNGNTMIYGNNTPEIQINNHGNNVEIPITSASPTPSPSSNHHKRMSVIKKGNRRKSVKK